MQRLEVSDAVRPLYVSLGVKGKTFVVFLDVTPQMYRHFRSALMAKAESNSKTSAHMYQTTRCHIQKIQ